MTDQGEDDRNRRPPRKGQFRPGQSGNPQGRPKGHKNLRTLLDKQLETKVTVTENGRTRTISKREAIALQLVNRASMGDPKAVATILALHRDHDDVLPTAVMSVLARAEDNAVMDGIIARIRAAAVSNHENRNAGSGAPDDPSAPGVDPGDKAPSFEGDA